jgi:hypothetical protein
MSYRVCTLIDSNLFSGSTEQLRNNLGGYFTVDRTDEENVDIDFRLFYADSPMNKNLYLAQSFTLIDLHGSGETTIAIPESAQNTDTIIPNKHFVCTVDGNPNHITDDKMWKIVWTGGTIDDVTYSPIYNAGTYNTFYTTVKKPYPKIASRKLSNPEAVKDYVEISYDYLHYREDYQNYVNDMESEMLIPNWYILKWAGINATASSDLRTEIYNYISYNGAIEDPWSFFATPPETSSAADFVGQYLDMASDGPTHNSSTRDYVNTRLKNIIFNDNSFEDYLEYSESIMPAMKLWEEGDPPSESMPYYIKINFNTEPEAELLGNIAKRHDFDTRLMRLLKTTFLNQLPEQITPSEISLQRYIQELSSSAHMDANTELKTLENVKYKSISLADLLLYSHAKIKCEITDFTILDSKNVETDSTYDTEGIYRSINVGNTLGVLDGLIEEWTSGSTAFGGFGTMDMTSLLNVESVAHEGHLSDRLNDAMQPKYNETIAYRVEKIGSMNGTEEVMQNFWFYNSDKMASNFDFFDTQVKYDKDYTYRVYAYVVVYGLKYKYSNLQLSRVIGTAARTPDFTGISTGEIGAKESENFCIEYYDPATDEAVSDLLTAGRATYDRALGDPGWTQISSLATDAQRIAVSRFDPGKAPYLANFLVTVEPDVQIVEVPMFEKTLRVQDNPPNRLNILPSYAQDNTNQLAFMASYESFAAAPYPNVVSAQDKINRDDYLHAKDLLLATELADMESVSRQTTIEIYRIETKPESFEDFDGALLRTVDLTDDTGDSSYTDIIFYDQVAPNRKYYYLFRALNDLNMPGYVDEIMEAELIDDGGYKYALFDTMFKEDLEINPFLQTTTTAKKVLQISPALQQIALDTDDVDFQDKAIDQIDHVKVGSAEDLLWDKTFKIRLTSKKTNKQIDLNITYNQTVDKSG